MARSLSVTRRRSHLVDLNLRARPNVAAYQFFAAANFDSSFTQFATVPAAGLRSVSVADIGPTDGQWRGLTRFLFDPSDYTASVAAVDDTKPFYLQIKQVSTAGVVGSAEAMHLVLPYNSAPDRPIILHGTAPNQASLSAALEIQLPMQCVDWEFQDQGSVILFVAFEPTGSEFAVNPFATGFTNYHHIRTSASQLFVRGNGGTTEFYASLTLKNNPLS